MSNLTDERAMQMCSEIVEGAVTMACAIAEEEPDRAVVLAIAAGNVQACLFIAEQLGDPAMMRYSIQAVAIIRDSTTRQNFDAMVEALCEEDDSE